MYLLLACLRDFHNVRLLVVSCLAAYSYHKDTFSDQQDVGATSEAPNKQHENSLLTRLSRASFSLIFRHDDGDSSSLLISIITSGAIKKVTVLSIYTFLFNSASNLDARTSVFKFSSFRKTHSSKELGSDTYFWYLLSDNYFDAEDEQWLREEAVNELYNMAECLMSAFLL